MSDPVRKSASSSQTIIDPVDHAKWLRDAIDASKHASEYAANYSSDEIAKVHCDERAMAFVDRIAGRNGCLRDQLLASAQWHMPPDEFRTFNADIEAGIALEKARTIVRDFDDAEQELQRMRVAFDKGENAS